MSKKNINRRTFTRQTSAGAVALSSLPVIANTVFGANDRVVIGAIGVGGRGTTLLSTFCREDDVSIAAICDVDDAHTAEGVERAGGKAKGYRDFRRMLEQKDIDAVMIGTPDHWHAIPTIQACKAGKDVYVEKPIAHNVEEGRAMVNTARETKRIVQMGTQQRSCHHWQKAVDIVQSGQLGNVCEIRVWNNFAGRDLGNPPDGVPPEGVDYDFWLGPAPKRPFNPNHFHSNALYFWDYAGGCVTSWGVHLLDIVYWAMNLKGPKSVAAAGGKFHMEDNRETPDVFSAVFDCPGFTMTYMLRHGNGLTRPLGQFGHSNHGVEFHSPDGSLYVDRQGFELRGVENRIPDQSVKGEYGTVKHIRNFLDCVKSRKKPNSSIELGHPPSVATFLANISYRVGRKIEWDPETETIRNDPEASKLLSREHRAPWGLT